MIIAADDMRYPHVMVIDDDGKHGRCAVTAKITMSSKICSGR